MAMRTRLQVLATSRWRRSYASFAEKVECVPWRLAPSQARLIMSEVAGNQFRLPRPWLAQLFDWLSFFNRPSTVRLLHFKPIYFPLWAFSFDVAADAHVQDHKAIWQINSGLATTRGTDAGAFRSMPLPRPPKSRSRPWDAADPPEPPKEDDEAVSVLTMPFQRFPIDIPAALRTISRSLCRIPQGDDADAVMRWEPPSVKFNLLAYYPLYVPMYMGEFESTDGSERRATVVCHGWSDMDTPDFCMCYRTWDEQWAGHQGRPFTIQSFLSPASDRLETLSSAVGSTISTEGNELVAKTLHSGPYMDSADADETAARALADPRVMSFSFVRENSHFVDCVRKSLHARGKHREARNAIERLKTASGVEELRDGVEDVVGWHLDPSGLQRLSLKEMEESLATLADEADAADKQVEASRPSWAKNLIT